MTNWRCCHCGQPIVLYWFGWKHHPGPGQKGCGNPERAPGEAIPKTVGQLEMERSKEVSN